MIGGGTRRFQCWQRGLAVAMLFGAGAWAGRPAAARRPAGRPVRRVVAIREVIVRREPVVIQAVTLAQLRAELHRARAAQTGYERQVAGQYQTIRRLQAQLDARLREVHEANTQRADQLNAQFEIILQAFGVVVFAIIGALLVALSRSPGREASAPGVAPPAVDWDPLQHQLREAKSALATVEARLRRLEASVDGG